MSTPIHHEWEHPPHCVICHRIARPYGLGTGQYATPDELTAGRWRWRLDHDRRAHEAAVVAPNPTQPRVSLRDLQLPREVD